MLIDSDRALALSHMATEDYPEDFFAPHIRDLLTDRKAMIVLLLCEWGELTEKQAADALGMDRLNFRIQREDWIAEAIEALR